MTKRKTKKAPRIAAGLRIRRRNASCQRPPVAVSSAISWASISAMLTGESFRPFPPRERAEGERRSRVANPRIDERVREVDEQVDEDEDDCQEEDPALENRVIPVEDRVA